MMTQSMDINAQDESHARRALEQQTMQVVLNENRHGAGYVVCFYHPNHAVSVSDIWSLFEGLGLHVQTHVADMWVDADHHKVWIHRFVGMWCDHPQPLSVDRQQQVSHGLQCVWQGTLRKSALNKLLIEDGISWRHIELLHVMVDYLRQLRPSYDTSLIEAAILHHLSLVALWIHMFEARFNPSQQATSPLPLHTARDVIQALPQHEHDIWNMLFDTLRLMVRTNFFQLHKNGQSKSYIAFKLDHHQGQESAHAAGIRFELFVSSRDMQGIHFRAGPIARGGIRWSDRLGDFRREILDLAQTQVLKNAVIVPTGAKGGFIVTHALLHQSPAERLAQGQRAYETLIHGLLDLTDNQQEGGFLPPEDTLCHDQPDAYLVVAADKGTASFSDIANSIALERGFWLGDAFASGGSRGYNHKALGITSAGAWESLKRHRHDLGWDQDRVMTVIGVGDMSGDVFGNGMLGSSRLQLLGAFDHRHIFIDPQPDPERSFQERQRLFNLTGSQWSDYQADVISQGGGVFDRAVREIVLTPEMRHMLHIHHDVISPDDLIRELLHMPVDMIWFGGIGTFVKGKQEDDTEIGDQANQWVRVHGDTLKARIVIEGANLGVTQAGRINYARAGGHINTDTIDNSGGVTCSDYEVNLKILLNQAVRQGHITLKERDVLLHDMTSQVVKKILAQSIQVNQILSCLEPASRDDAVDYVKLRQALKVLRRSGHPVAHLASERTILEQGFTRPELCLILAYAKMALKRVLLENQTWMSEEGIAYAMQSYIPDLLLNHKALDIYAHPLKTSIVATVWSNEAINRYGPCFIMPKEGKMKAAVLVRRMGLFMQQFMQPSCQDLWHDIDQQGLHMSTKALYEKYRAFKAAMDEALQI